MPTEEESLLHQLLRPNQTLYDVNEAWITMVVAQEAFRMERRGHQVVLAEVELAGVDHFLPLGITEHHLHVLAFKGDVFRWLTVSRH